MRCSDFDFYDEAGFQFLREGWSNSDLMIFAQNAIDPDIIEASYRLLPSKPVVDFNALASEASQAAAVFHIVPGRLQSGIFGRGISHRWGRVSSSILKLSGLQHGVPIEIGVNEDTKLIAMLNETYKTKLTRLGLEDFRKG